MLVVRLMAGQDLSAKDVNTHTLTQQSISHHTLHNQVN